MRHSFEQLSDFDKGIFFRQAGEKAISHAVVPVVNRVTTEHFFHIYRVEPTAEVIQQEMEFLDYQMHGLARPVEGPRSSTAEYFS